MAVVNWCTLQVWLVAWCHTCQMPLWLSQSNDQWKLAFFEHYGDQTLSIHSSIHSSSIQAFTCVVQIAQDGIFTFFSGRFVFPLNMTKGGNSFPAAVQHKVAVIQFFSEPVVRTRTVFFPFRSTTNLELSLRKQEFHPCYICIQVDNHYYPWSFQLLLDFLF